MKMRINEQGYLERVLQENDEVYFEPVHCIHQIKEIIPQKDDSNGEISYTPIYAHCGDWCPFFGEPEKLAYVDLIVLKLCSGQLQFHFEADCQDFADFRGLPFETVIKFNKIWAMEDDSWRKCFVCGDGWAEGYGNRYDFDPVSYYSESGYKEFWEHVKRMEEK